MACCIPRFKVVGTVGSDTCGGECECGGSTHSDRCGAYCICLTIGLVYKHQLGVGRQVVVIYRDGLVGHRVANKVDSWRQAGCNRKHNALCQVSTGSIYRFKVVAAGRHAVGKYGGGARAACRGVIPGNCLTAAAVYKNNLVVGG